MVDPELSPQEALEIIKPYPDEFMKAYKVDNRVGKVSENDADLIKEINQDAQLSIDL